MAKQIQWQYPLVDLIAGVMQVGISGSERLSEILWT